MAKIKLKDLLNLSRKIEIAGVTYSTSQLLEALFTQHPESDVFQANIAYKIKLKRKKGKEVIHELVLPNDLIRRESVGQAKRVPHVALKPVYKNGARILKPQLVFKRKKNEKNKKRFSVVKAKAAINQSTPELGEGAQGKVYLVQATLAETDSGWISKNHKQRVMKVQTHNTRHPLTRAEKEADALEILAKPKSKNLVVAEIDGWTYSYLVEEKAAGIDLDDFLKQDKAGSIQRGEALASALTIEERYLLTINLLRALKEIHDKGLVHRDIKPKNIKINPQTLAVTIMDTGEVKKLADKNDPKTVGTPGYMAKEFFVGSGQPNIDERIDIYSMALIISEVWRANPRSANGFIEIAQFFSETGKDVFPELFAGIEGLTQTEKDILQLLINQMTAPPDDRISIDTSTNIVVQAAQQQSFLQVDVFNRAEHTREEFKKLANPDEYIIDSLESLLASHSNAKMSDDEQKVYTKALAAYQKLKGIIQVHEGILLLGNSPDEQQLLELEKAFDDAAEAKSEFEHQFNLMSPGERLIKTLSDELDQLTEPEIQQFVRALDVKVFMGLETGKILETATSIMRKTDENTIFLPKALAEIKKIIDERETYLVPFALEEKQLLADLHKLTDRYLKTPFEFDGLDALNKQMEELQIKSRVERFMELEKANVQIRKLSEQRDRLDQILSELELDKFSHLPEAELHSACASAIYTKIDLLHASYDHFLRDTKNKVSPTFAKELEERNTLSVKKIDGIKDAVDKVQKDFNDSQMMRPYIEITNRIKSIRQNLNKENELDILKEELLQVIESYCKTTFTKENIKKSDRIASKGRQDEILELLLKMIFCTHVSDLRPNIQPCLDKMKTGAETNLFFGSLFSKLNKNKPEFKYSALGKRIYRSELRTNLQAVLDKCNKEEPKKETEKSRRKSFSRNIH